MFNAKSLNEEVRLVKGKLDDLERQEYSQKIGEIQNANRELEKKYQGEIEKLQKMCHKIAVRLGMLQGIAAVLFAVLSGVAVYYIDRYQAESSRNRALPEAVLIGYLQDKFDDTMERISLFAPTDEDKTMVAEVDELREKLSRLDIENEKFDALSVLINALKLIVNEGKGKEASALLDQKALPVSKDRFIASRALILQAMTLTQASQQCDDPASTIKLVNGAIQRDSRAAAAFNLLGACLAEESKTLMYKQPEQWQLGGETFQAALINTELAYQFKPTQWSRTRSLNNKVWETSEFLLVAETQNRLNEPLHLIGYKTMEDFFDQSAKDLDECQLLDQRQPTYLETRAELYGLEYAYYQNPSYKDNRKAEGAYEKMIQALTDAINMGLLRKMTDPGEAEKYFSEDDLLAPLFTDSKNPPTLDARIKKVIEQRVHAH